VGPEDYLFFDFLDEVAKINFTSRADFHRDIEKRNYQIQKWMQYADFRTFWIPLKERIIHGLS